MNIKMVINSTYDYCASYVRTMYVIMADNSTYDYCASYVRTVYVIMADGTFPIQSNLLMHSLSIQ